MKKVFLFFAVAMIFASCAPKATEETEVVDESAVVVEVEEVMDTTVVDTTVVAE